MCGFRRDHFVRQLEVLALRLLGRRQHGLVGSRSAEVGREVGPRVSATCRYGLARLLRGWLSIWLGTIGEGLVVDRA